ncbi:Vfa1 protein [Saccharomycopsis crataegensis]|uniref:Vfa1 protein n=1 Tax=Saccharomycopsis crataegensis TaxID=43959 RepID=A0AAV5QQU0_9ASCO|nr:Vfa1 protein [Saccharomycopsis crataegensis]
MSAAMFENIYRVRKVSEKDGKACFICYKPSSTVLITQDQKDLFYICPNHLKDSRNFGNPIYGPELEELKQRLKAKEDREKILTFLINEKTKFGSFGKILGWGDKPKKEESEDKDKDTKKTERSKSIDELRSDLNTIMKDKSSIEEQIRLGELNVKQFVLNSDIFKIRIRAHRKKIDLQQRAAKIQSGEVFPSVPQNLP